MKSSNSFIRVKDSMILVSFAVCDLICMSLEHFANENGGRAALHPKGA